MFLMDLHNTRWPQIMSLAKYNKWLCDDKRYFCLPQSGFFRTIVTPHLRSLNFSTCDDMQRSQKPNFRSFNRDDKYWYLRQSALHICNNIIIARAVILSFSGISQTLLQKSRHHSRQILLRVVSKLYQYIIYDIIARYVLRYCEMHNLLRNCDVFCDVLKKFRRSL